MSRFSVQSFSRLAFTDACKGPTPFVGKLEDKQQVRYLAQYLADLGCKTILIENDYIDRDFVEDHAAYYVKCFKPYRNRCRRLHFLRSSLSTRALRQYLTSGVGDLAQLDSKHYLGWVVLRPLPQTIIGKSCLATYRGSHERIFNSALVCKAHVLGRDLEVLSVPFQEQDTVLSACATTAVWSALQKTGDLFRHTVPSPAEITSLATQSGAHRGRVFPSLGLELGQMCRAVHSVGLETELREGSKLEDIRGLIRGYGAIGLPTILGVNRPGSVEDAHAITVVGYRQPSNSAPSSGRFALASDSITQFYVHDDQLGPFARAQIVSSKKLTVADPQDLAKTQTLQIFAVLVPVHRKIRVRYERALEDTICFDDLVLLACRARGVRAPAILWDVHLDTGVRIQKEYEETCRSRPALRQAVLEAALPRFVWRSTGTVKGRIAVDLIMDATDVERGFSALGVLSLSPDIEATIAAFRNSADEIRSLIALHPARKELESAFEQWRLQVRDPRKPLGELVA